MDLYCANCAEPWDMDYVLHEAEKGEFKRKGSLISKCPACDENGPAKEEVQDMIGAIALVMGDDIDGAAAEMEDWIG